jgi:hypothetical protein
MIINGSNFTIGADPEVFLGDPQDGSFVSAHDLLPGTKVAPHKVPYGAVQVDGMAAEFNIDPAEDLEEFSSNLREVQNTLKGMIGDKVFLDKCSVMFDEQFAKGIPDLNLLLGCDADYNGWTMAENPSPDGEKLMRTVGGHIHIGGDLLKTDSPFCPSHFEMSARLARILDAKLGVYSVLWDDDDDRRTMYGRAGSFRPKTYGMEYRTLSNKWIFNPKLVSFVYSAVKDSIKEMFNGFEPEGSYREIIDNSDRGNSFFKGNQIAEGLI